MRTSLSLAAAVAACLSSPALLAQEYELFDDLRAVVGTHRGATGALVNATRLPGDYLLFEYQDNDPACDSTSLAQLRSELRLLDGAGAEVWRVPLFDAPVPGKPAGFLSLVSAVTADADGIALAVTETLGVPDRRADKLCVYEFDYGAGFLRRFAVGDADFAVANRSWEALLRHGGAYGFYDASRGEVVKVDPAAPGAVEVTRVFGDLDVVWPSRGVFAFRTQTNAEVYRLDRGAVYTSPADGWPRTRHNQPDAYPLRIFPDGEHLYGIGAYVAPAPGAAPGVAVARGRLADSVIAWTELTSFEVAGGTSIRQVFPLGPDSLYLAMQGNGDGVCYDVSGVTVSLDDYGRREVPGLVNSTEYLAEYVLPVEGARGWPVFREGVRCFNTTTDALHSARDGFPAVVTTPQVSCGANVNRRLTDAVPDDDGGYAFSYFSAPRALTLYRADSAGVVTATRAVEHFRPAYRGTVLGARERLFDLSGGRLGMVYGYSVLDTVRTHLYVYDAALERESAVVLGEGILPVYVTSFPGDTIAVVVVGEAAGAELLLLDAAGAVLARRPLAAYREGLQHQSFLHTRVHPDGAVALAFSERANGQTLQHRLVLDAAGRRVDSAVGPRLHRFAFAPGGSLLEVREVAAGGNEYRVFDAAQGLAAAPFAPLPGHATPGEAHVFGAAYDTAGAFLIAYEPNPLTGTLAILRFDPATAELTEAFASSRPLTPESGARFHVVGGRVGLAVYGPGFSSYNPLHAYVSGRLRARRAVEVVGVATAAAPVASLRVESPVRDRLRVHLPAESAAEGASLAVVTLQGRRLPTGAPTRVGEGTWEVSLPQNAPAGTYVVRAGGQARLVVKL